jgi:phosphoribosylformylglycinamidine (FGAM) synthase-like amidotransferase family enzyme
MMPHPERVVEGLIGGEDGRLIFNSLLTSWQGGGRVDR